MKYTYASTLFVALGLVLSTACNDDTTPSESNGSGSGSESETGDGDGDPTTGDGDGDPTTGDGDGDGDGDPTTGDGDGDPTTGDGDGDLTTGDGDGDPTTGDGDGDGDGDPTTGDGDGDPGDNNIYELQDGTVPTDTPVNVDGVWVTAVTGNGFFAQEEAGGPNSGIWVFVGNMGPDITGIQIGDLVDVEGVVTEFNDITEIDATAGTVVEVGVLDPTPAPDLITVADLAVDVGEPWESVFVRIEGNPINVVDLPGFDEFIVNDGSGDGLIDNYLYNLIVDGTVEFPNFAIGASFTAIQGPVNFSFANFKIAPRFAADLEGYMESGNMGFGVNDLIPGDLVITEIMYDPNFCNDNVCEWIEVYNDSGMDVDLAGLRVQDSLLNQTGVVTGPLVVPADSYVWIGNGAMATWGYTNPADGYYGNAPALNNNTDMVVLLNDVEILDQTHNYNDNMTPAGVALQLDPTMIDALANDTPASWCLATTDWGDGDLGTPGAVNDPCL